MKSSQLKILIKEAVKEAIHEELKEILLEAVKTPKVTTVASATPPPVVEHQTPQQPVMSAQEKRAAYQSILGDMSTGLTTQNIPQQSFQPQAGYDVANGTLPQGNVDMSQIASLMGKK